MAAGYENAHVTQIVSIFSMVFTLFYNDTQTVPLDIEKLVNGELWRLISSQIIFRNKAQAVVGLILLYTCRQFERQMGSRKFGAFLMFSWLSSTLLLLAFSVVAASVGLHLVPSSGPYCLIFALVAFYYSHIPKLHSSQYALLGVEFSEKSWIYLLAAQLLTCDGLSSVASASAGLLAGFLYDRDGFGIQSYRLPQRVEAACAYAGSLITSLIPQPATAGNATPAAGAAPRNTRHNLLNPRQAPDQFNAQQQHLNRLPQTAAAPPSEEAVAVLMGMGFEREAVVRALQATDNNTEAAANRLLR